MPEYLKAIFGKEPADAVSFLENKLPKLTYNYKEMMHEAHQKAFTVAKIARLDLLVDMHSSLIEAQKNGVGFEEWKKNIKPTLQKYGWIGDVEVTDPKTGEVKNIYVGSRRLKTIYETNMRVAYQTARYKQMMELEDSVYWRYESLLVGENRRLSHKRVHGTVLHRDNPWWKANYPPNGWGCKCKVRAFSKEVLIKKGFQISEKEPTNIASPDWAYDIGAGSRVSKIEKIDLDETLSDLPMFVPRKEYTELSAMELKQKFYADLGVKDGDVFIDKVGDPATIDDELFRAGDFGKITKKKRHFYVDEFAGLLKDPDEIYIEFDKKRGTYIKKFFRYFQNENGSKRALIAIFEYLQNKTQGVSLYFVDTASSVEKKRMEKLVYQKEPSDKAR